MKVAYNWLKEFVDIDMPPKKLASMLTMAGLEVEAIEENALEAQGVENPILEINITPNRPDCLSTLGVAREISVITGNTLRCQHSLLKDVDSDEITKIISVEILEPDICDRYTVRIIQDVTIEPSPSWLKSRLTSYGIRSVNNVVDVTNFVMLETGQPLHAFDYEKITGKSITICSSSEGDCIVTLDAAKRILKDKTPVICDLDGPIALAGIIGGRRTEITDYTKSVLLECAFFDPVSVRKASKELGISTDSSYRFERKVDIEMIRLVIDRAAQLIEELAGGRIVGGCIDLYPKEYVSPRIEFNINKINAVLGTSLDKVAIETILINLGIKIEKTPNDNGVLMAVPPSYRSDIVREVDLIEEVGRVSGYDNIPATLPKGRLLPGKKGKAKVIRDTIRDSLTRLGLYEVNNYSFIGERIFNMTGMSIDEGVRLLNPLSEEQSVLRRHLFTSLINNLTYNINRKNEDVKIFEIGHTFIPTGKKPKEEETVSGLIFGSRNGFMWSQPKDQVDFYDIKGVAESLLSDLYISGVSFEGAGSLPFLNRYRSAIVFIDGNKAGFVGALNQALLDNLDLEGQVYIFELSIDAMIKRSVRDKRFRPLPRYPGSKRDISIIVDRTISYEEIRKSINRIETKMVDDIEVFDVYYGKEIDAGKVSIGIRITYQLMERTLTDEEINYTHSRILKELIRKFDAGIRGYTM